MLRRWMLMFAVLGTVLLLRGSVFAQENAFVVVEEIPVKLELNERLYTMSVSADGRYITYNITASDTRWIKVVLYDRVTDARTTLSNQIPSAYEVLFPHISANGRYLVFTAFETPNWEGKVYGYLFDLKTGAYRNIFQGANGQILQSADSTAVTDMSSDGRYIVYTSSAYNPFDGKNTNCIDYNNTSYPCNHAYLYDRVTGKTERISVNSNEELANGDSLGTRVSDDGRYVVFESAASNLDGGTVCPETYCHFQLYVRDRKSGSTLQLTKKLNGQPSVGLHIPLFFNLSPDGKYATYVSSSHDLMEGVPPEDVPDDTYFGNIFLQNIVTGERELVNVSSQGTQSTYETFSTDTIPGAFSYDNRYTIFTSKDVQAMTDDPTACEAENCPRTIFLRDHVAGSTTSITPFLSGLLISDFSSNIVGDANQILLSVGGNIEVWAAANATLPQPSNLKAKRISNTQIDLTWTDNTGGVAAYHVERSLDGLTKWQEVSLTAVGATSFSDKTVVCGARYHYRVSAANDSAGTVSINSFYDDANIPACTLPPISLKLPANGASIDTATPTFTWEPVHAVKQYRLVVTDSDDDKPIDQVIKADAIAEICDAELCSFDLSANGLALPDDDYTWKVKAKVISGLKTESGVRTLEVDAFSAPTLLTPADGATDVALSPVFSWQEVGVGSSYKVVVKQGDVEIFDHTVTATNCVETVCTLDTAGLLTLEASQTYVWRVIAKNNGAKEKSAKWTFTTGSESGLLPLQASGN